MGEYFHEVPSSNEIQGIFLVHMEKSDFLGAEIPPYRQELSGVCVSVCFESMCVYQGMHITYVIRSITWEITTYKY